MTGLALALFLAEINVHEDIVREIQGSVIYLLYLTSPLMWFAYRRWQVRDELAAEQMANDGHFEDAIALLQDKIRRKGSTLLLLNNLATYLDAVGAFEEALQALEQAEQRFGKQHILTLNRAFFLTHAGRTEEALAIVERLVKIVPGDFDLICHYALLLLRINLRDEAEQQYLRAEVRYLWEKSDELKKRWLPLLNKLRAAVGDGRHQKLAMPNHVPVDQHITAVGKHP